MPTLNYPASTSLPVGDGMTACGKKPHQSESLAALSFVSRFKVSKNEQKKIPIPPRRLSAIPAGPTHTTPACSQWWGSNLTDWAQGFVCLKPLTYFYSHCRSQRLYCVIAELMLHVCSKTGRNCSEKNKLAERHLKSVSNETDFSLSYLLKGTL